MRTKTDPRRQVVGARLSNESRLAQSKRLGLSESTLRWIEAKNRWPANAIIRAHYLSQLGAEAR